MITLDKIGKSFIGSGKHRVDALKNIGCTFPDRGMVFVLGKSGSGKSTLLNIIAGLLKPDSGKIFYSGFHGDKPNIAFCFQSGNVFPELTVAENITIVASLKDRDVIKSKVDATLSELGLSGFADRKTYELSGGEQQRVALARALFTDAEVLLADEPTGSLDGASAKQVFDSFKEISKSRLVVVVTHDAESAIEYGDMVLNIKDGCIAQDSNNTTIEKKTVAPLVGKKRHLNAKTVSKLSLTYVKRRPLAFILTTLLTSFSFAAASIGVGLVSGASNGDVATAVIKSETKDIVCKNLIGEKSAGFAKDDIDAVEKKLGVDCVPLYGNPVYGKETSNLNYGYRLDSSKEYVHNSLLQSSPNIFKVPASEENLKILGLDLVAGRLPVGNEEIAIPLCQYDEYANAGFRGYAEGISSDRFSTPEEFLSLNPSVSTTCRIVGIIDTKLPENLFSYKTDDNKDIVYSFSQQAYEKGIANSLHVARFVDPATCVESTNFAVDIYEEDAIRGRIEIGENREDVVSFTSGASDIVSFDGVTSGIYGTPSILKEALVGTINAPYYDFCSYGFSNLPAFSDIERIETPTAEQAFGSFPGFEINNAFTLSACCEYVKTKGLPIDKTLLKGNARSLYSILKNQYPSISVPDFDTAEGEEILKTFLALSLSMSDISFLNGGMRSVVPTCYYNDIYSIGVTGETLVESYATDYLSSTELNPKEMCFKIESDFAETVSFTVPCAGIAVCAADYQKLPVYGYRPYRMTQDWFGKFSPLFPTGRNIRAYACKTPSQTVLSDLYGSYARTHMSNEGYHLESELAQFVFEKSLSSFWSGSRSQFVWIGIGLFALNILLQLAFMLLRMSGRQKTAGMLLGLGGGIGHIYLYASNEELLSTIGGSILGIVIGLVISSIVNANFATNSGVFLPIFTFPYVQMLLWILGSLSLIALMYLPMAFKLKKTGALNLMKREG